jgi:hypothetical protein
VTSFLLSFSTRPLSGGLTAGGSGTGGGGATTGCGSGSHSPARISTVRKTREVVADLLRAVHDDDVPHREAALELGAPILAALADLPEVEAVRVAGSQVGAEGVDLLGGAVRVLLAGDLVAPMAQDSMLGRNVSV